MRATGVRVEADDGQAVLLDLRRRHRTAIVPPGAVRRGEAMLSHLVATSPDVITLSDLATSRYAMVNQTFERITPLRSSPRWGPHLDGARHLAGRWCATT
ncbi:MAG: hypothetical protein IPH51_08785 [Rubrivivax sp.]|nr:hypothetical protein [Rubrivivax sp.]